MAFEHHIAYTTAKIDIESRNAPRSFGTGFFYEAPLNDGTGRVILLLISNKHVFKNAKGKLIISLNRKKEPNKGAGETTPNFGDIVPFEMEEFDDRYFVHPNQEVDLACVNVSHIASTDVFYRSLTPGFLTAINYDLVAAGSEIIFVGYPQGYYDKANNLPLIRKGSIASMPHVDFDGKGQVVIDVQIFPGSSGSPVFVDWNKEYYLLGVVSDAVISLTPLQNIPTNMRRNRVQQILGLGIVVKQRHVQELIDYAVQEYIQRKSPSS